jgi:hypothetical protein
MEVGIYVYMNVWMHVYISTLHILTRNRARLPGGSTPVGAGGPPDTRAGWCPDRQVATPAASLEGPLTASPHVVLHPSRHGEEVNPAMQTAARSKELFLPEGPGRVQTGPRWIT